jgi:hypothetical protein
VADVANPTIVDSRVSWGTSTGCRGAIASLAPAMFVPRRRREGGEARGAPRSSMITAAVAARPAETAWLASFLLA